MTANQHYECTINHVLLIISYTRETLLHKLLAVLMGGGGGGGGGGDHPDFFVKLNFEIAVDQKTRARDQTFEGVPDSGCPPLLAGQPRPYLVNF